MKSGAPGSPQTSGENRHQATTNSVGPRGAGVERRRRHRARGAMHPQRVGEQVAEAHRPADYGTVDARENADIEDRRAEVPERDGEQFRQVVERPDGFAARVQHFGRRWSTPTG